MQEAGQEEDEDTAVAAVSSRGVQAAQSPGKPPGKSPGQSPSKEDKAMWGIAGDSFGRLHAALEAGDEDEVRAACPPLDFPSPHTHLTPRRQTTTPQSPARA